MKLPVLALALLALTPNRAAAEVVDSSPQGFVTHDEAFVDAAPDAVWAALVEPRLWWNPQHSWSLDAANFTLAPVAGGCFCETLVEGGSVEHMRVIHAAPHRLLRLQGALGPLQSEPLSGVLTIVLAEQEGGTRIAWTYAVGGYARFAIADVAGPVDRVQSEQLHRLASYLSRHAAAESASAPAP